VGLGGYEFVCRHGSIDFSLAENSSVFDAISRRGLEGVACSATVSDMAEIIPQRELRNNNAAIVDRVARGQTFVVTRHGTPVAELRPVGRGRGRLVRR